MIILISNSLILHLLETHAKTYIPLSEGKMKASISLKCEAILVPLNGKKDKCGLEPVGSGCKNFRPDGL